MRPGRLGRYYATRFKRLRGNPRYVAGGVAVGVFAALTPTVPFNTLLVIILAFLTRTSLVAAFLTSVIVSNPLTLAPIYSISFALGLLVTPYDLHWNAVAPSLAAICSGGDFAASAHDLWQVGWQAILVLQVGGLLFALPFTALSYFAAWRFFTHLRRKRLEKHVLH
jgi:uncharacterized protein (DUF2062 family)